MKCDEQTDAGYSKICMQHTINRIIEKRWPQSASTWTILHQ